MKYVYLAGPITKQNPMHNVHRAVAAAVASQREVHHGCRGAS
jgi:hypothetical protein